MTPVAPIRLGLASCPNCGFDDDGALRVTDLYYELDPGYQSPGTLVIWGDDPYQHDCEGVRYCPGCDAELDPHGMRMAVRA